MPVSKRQYLVCWEEQKAIRGEWVIYDNLDAAIELYDEMCSIGKIKVYMGHVIKAADIKWVSPSEIIIDKNIDNVVYISDVNKEIAKEWKKEDV